MCDVRLSLGSCEASGTVGRWGETGDRSNIRDKDKPTVAGSLSAILTATRGVARSRTRRRRNRPSVLSTSIVLFPHTGLPNLDLRLRSANSHSESGRFSCGERFVLPSWHKPEPRCLRQKSVTGNFQRRRHNQRVPPSPTLPPDLLGGNVYVSVFQCILPPLSDNVSSLPDIAA